MISLPETKGARVVKFIEKFCVHGEGDFFGEPFKLDQWQQAIIYEMYEIKDNGERKYREALIGLPKGNGKTALAAAIGLYELLGSGVTSPLVAVAAASYEQANLVFGTMKTMCEESIFLRDMVETFENEIQVKNAPGRAFRVAAKAGTADFTIFTTQGTGQLAIYDNTNTAERFRITSAGLVGIGSTAPKGDVDIGEEFTLHTTTTTVSSTAATKSFLSTTRRYGTQPQSPTTATATEAYESL